MNSRDINYAKKDGVDVIYLAGGCFWGVEKFMTAIPGVLRATSGYVNGNPNIVPTYEKVCSGDTGYKEAVRVEYNKNVVSLDALLYSFFRIIDPTLKNRQGNDRGSQYQSGIYYNDDNSKAVVEKVVATEKLRYKKFSVEIEPLSIFYEAEKYHQSYLMKNKGGYCHISNEKVDMAAGMIVDPSKYDRPHTDEIRKKLTELQFSVTQNDATEPPFDNDFWKSSERGIYVDVVTGEPLFSSRGKYAGSCGWPSFSEPIDENALVYIKDYSHGMVRTEVRSRVGNSHLGHVFVGDPESPNGVRFCINSASLRFIPYDDMEEEDDEKLKKFIVR